MNVDFTVPRYTLYFNETERKEHGGTGIFISDNLTFKQRPDLLINKSGRLETTFIELIFPNKRNVDHDCVCKHRSMRINRFNSEYLTPLLTNTQKEENACTLIGDFNINLLNAQANINISEFYDNMSSYFFASCILQPIRLTKNSKTLLIIFS